MWDTEDTEDTDSGGDLHLSFTTSGQFVAVGTVERNAVEDRRNVPDCGQIDGWKEASLTSGNIFQSNQHQALLLERDSFYELNLKAFYD